MIAKVAVSRDGITYVDSYNPRLGAWAREAALAAAERGLRRALETRAAQRANQSHPLWPQYAAARTLARDLGLRAHNTAFAAAERVSLEAARAAGSVEDALRRLLPHPSVSTPDATV